VRVLDFVKDVRIEANKVSWPAMKEVAITSAFVIVVSGIAGVMFLLIDSIVYKLIKLLLGIGG
jgi:preprotein translocase subunit SecE